MTLAKAKRCLLPGLAVIVGLSLQVLATQLQAAPIPAVACTGTPPPTEVDPYGWKGTEGDDEVTCTIPYGNAGVVETFAGNDIITLDGANLEAIRAGEGNDEINLLSGYVDKDVEGNDGEDTIVLNGATLNSNIDGGGDADTIDLLSGSARLVDGGGGNDVITLDGAAIAHRILGGDGDDWIELLSGSVNADQLSNINPVVFSGTGADTIILNGANIFGMISSGDGADIIQLLSGKVHDHVTAGADDDIITINGAIISGWVFGDGGNDTFYFKDGYAIGAQGGAGDDVFWVSEDGAASTIYGDGALKDGEEAGDDTFYLYGSVLRWAIGNGGNDTFVLDGAKLLADIRGDNYLTDPDEFGDDVIHLIRGEVANSVHGDRGSDWVRVYETFDLSDIGNNLDGGDDHTIADGEIDTVIIETSGSIGIHDLINWELIWLSGSTLELHINSSYRNNFQTGSADGYGMFLQNSTLRLSGLYHRYDGRIIPFDTFVFEGDLTIDGGSTLVWKEEEPALEVQIIGDVRSTGLIDLRTGQLGDQLTVSGNYEGGGGLYFEVMLDDGTTEDASDVMLVEGNTSGRSFVFIKNEGGVGGETGTGPTDGIKLIEVLGESAGSFQLGHRVEAGAYRYNLAKADGQNWYLQSAGVSSAGAVCVVLPTSLSSSTRQLVGTYYERTGAYLGSGGDRRQLRGNERNTDQTYQHAGEAAPVLWVRPISVTSSSEGSLSMGGEPISFDSQMSAIQWGGNRTFALSPHSDLVLTGFAHYVNLESSSNISNAAKVAGSMDAIGYGAGLGVTFKSEREGAESYVDLVAAVTGYDVDLTAGDVVGTSTNALNWTVAGELGARVPIGDQFSLTAQVQLSYQHEGMDDFVDAGGAATSFDAHGVVSGRVGVSAEYEMNQSTRIYGQFDLLQQFDQSPSVTIAGTKLSMDEETLAYEVSLGAQWAGESVPGRNAWVEVSSGAPFSGEGTEIWSATTGVRLAF